MDNRFGIVFTADTNAKSHAMRTADMKIHDAVLNRDVTAEP